VRVRGRVPFADRDDAGRQLARELERLRGLDTVVLGLPRGGVPVAAHVARGLGAPLDVIVVRKLGFPGHEEYAMGAIGEGGCEVLDRGAVTREGVDDDQVDAVVRREGAELEARLRRLRGSREPVDLTGRVALVVDDGIATGATARVAVQVARLRGAARVVVAAPVGPTDAADVLEADEVVLLAVPDPLLSVGRWYRSFTATSDAEVAALLARASSDG